MEGREKGLFPSKFTKSPKFESTGLEENNENDSSQDNMIPMSQNYKKTVGKHFMSPTISAASKAAAPRKKILAERTENSRNFEAQNHWKKSPRNCFDRFSSRVVDPEDDGGTKAYDPLKNFLSPRPKYLRFNPNRRHEILERLEREELNRSFESRDVSDEELSSADEIKDSCLPPEESVAKSKTREKIEDDDEDTFDDDEEEERGWCLRGVFKFKLALIACFLSTSYICLTNSPISSPTQTAILDPRDGSIMFKNQTLEFISMKMHKNGFFEVGVGDHYNEVEDVVIDENSNGGIEESFEADNVEGDVENRHEKEHVRNESEDIKDETVTAVEFEGERVSEFEYEVDNFEQSIAAESDETADAIKPSYMGLNEENVNKYDGEETEIIVGGKVNSEKQNFVELIGSETNEGEDAGGSLMAMEIESSNQLQEIELSGEPISEETQNGSMMMDGDSTDTVNEVDETKYDTEVELEKTGWNAPLVIGVLVASILSTSLAVVYHSKKGRSTPAEETEPMRKPHKFVMDEKVTPLLPSIERKVEFLARPMPLSSYPPMEEAPKEMNHHIHAPSVELIGEIVVGKVSSRFKSSEKYQTTESEERNATSYAMPSTDEHSTTSSLSHGSFTTERKKISKNEGGRGGEAMDGVTPVRRSSRLRNRAAVTSP